MLSSQHLRVQQYDGAKNLVNIDSLAVINPQQWYYVAAVNDGSQLSLWLDSGAGYELQGSVAVNGALYQGPQLLGDFNGDKPLMRPTMCGGAETTVPTRLPTPNGGPTLGRKTIGGTIGPLAVAQFNGATRGLVRWHDR